MKTKIKTQNLLQLSQRGRVARVKLPPFGRVGVGYFGKGWGWALVLLLSSCNNVPNSPGWEYMPDMYRSSSYETDGANGMFHDSMANRSAVAGTISQGWIPNSEFSALKVPYPYKNDSAGYENSGRFLKDPFPASP